jgi:hypothetical protein
MMVSTSAANKHSAVLCSEALAQGETHCIHGAFEQPQTLASQVVLAVALHMQIYEKSKTSCGKMVGSKSVLMALSPADVKHALL